MSLGISVSSNPRMHADSRAGGRSRVMQRVFLGGANRQMENSMRTNVGLWIDHRKANIVAITTEGEEIKMITSRLKNNSVVQGQNKRKW